jgi:hypothetical protein
MMGRRQKQNANHTTPSHDGPHHKSHVCVLDASQGDLVFNLLGVEAWGALSDDKRIHLQCSAVQCNAQNINRTSQTDTHT